MIPGSALVELLIDGVVVAGLIEHLAHRNAGKHGDDELVAGCHDYILAAASDADRRGKVCAVTGLDWRSQLTVQEAEALEEEARLRRMPNRN